MDFNAGLYCTHQDISPEYASILLVRNRQTPNHCIMCWQLLFAVMKIAVLPSASYVADYEVRV